MQQQYFSSTSSGFWIGYNGVHIYIWTRRISFWMSSSAFHRRSYSEARVVKHDLFFKQIWKRIGTDVID